MTAAIKQFKMYPVTPLQENKIAGFVRLYRSTQNKAWYKKSEYVHLWIHLFIKATRQPKEDWFKGKTILLKPGQFVTGRIKLSEETGINQSKIERILKCFESEQQIKQESCTKSRLISIVNWHLYQAVEQEFEQQPNNNRTTTEQQVNTKQEVDNIDNKDNNYLDAGASPPKNFKQLTDKEFSNEVQKFKGQYPYEILNGFYKYWKEKNTKGKMRFQLEKTWEIELRLENWARRQEGYEPKKSKNATHQSNNSAGKQQGAVNLIASLQTDLANAARATGA